jgi:glycosyltransferase involved in cell wall biosynthesis/peptidoglycan/xylan/chitin deacetylase (PgdA/CDA1 family)
MATRSKVAHVVLSLEPGGMERFVCNLAASAEMQDIATVVVCLDERGSLAGIVEAAGGQVLLLKRGAGFDVHVVFRLARLFRDLGVASVHTHSLDAMLYGGLAAALARVPNRIHTQHNTQLRTYSLPDRWKFRCAARLFSTIAAVSEGTAREAAAHGAAPRQLRVIPNGIDAAQFSHHVTYNGGAHIGCVARLSPEKGIDRLLDAFAGVLRARPDARLSIAGDGPSRPLLEAHARELNLGTAVEFLGFRQEVAPVLADLDVFVLPSLTEGVPLALLEAMAAGLPAVATAVGGVPEVVEDGSSGILVAPGDAPALERTVLGLLAAPEQRAALGANARDRVEHAFSLQRMALGYRELYVRDPLVPAWKRALKHALHHLPARWILWRGRPGSPDVALTFDDGPDANSTPRILDLLRSYNVRATFFLVGQKIAAERALVRRILEEGHEIGNHSFSHPDFRSLTCREAMREIERTEAVLRRVTGLGSHLFRPPKGKLTLGSLAAAWRKGMTVVMWSADLKDFRARTSEEIIEALHANPIRPGDIVLYHGINSAALEALPLVLEQALRASRKAVPVSQVGGL